MARGVPRSVITRPAAAATRMDVMRLLPRGLRRPAPVGRRALDGFPLVAGCEPESGPASLVENDVICSHVGIPRRAEGQGPCRGPAGVAPDHGVVDVQDRGATLGQALDELA